MCLCWGSDLITGYFFSFLVLGNFGLKEERRAASYHNGIEVTSTVLSAGWLLSSPLSVAMAKTETLLPPTFLSSSSS